MKTHKSRTSGGWRTTVTDGGWTRTVDRDRGGKVTTVTDENPRGQRRSFPGVNSAFGKGGATRIDRPWWKL